MLGLYTRRETVSKRPSTQAHIKCEKEIYLNEKHIIRFIGRNWAKLSFARIALWFLSRLNIWLSLFGMWCVRISFVHGLNCCKKRTQKKQGTSLTRKTDTYSSILIWMAKLIDSFHRPQHCECEKNAVFRNKKPRFIARKNGKFPSRGFFFFLFFTFSAFDFVFLLLRTPRNVVVPFIRTQCTLDFDSLLLFVQLLWLYWCNGRLCLRLYMLSNFFSLQLNTEQSQRRPCETNHSTVELMELSRTKSKIRPTLLAFSQIFEPEGNALDTYVHNVIVNRKHDSFV